MAVFERFEALILSSSSLTFSVSAKMAGQVMWYDILLDHVLWVCVMYAN